MPNTMSVNKTRYQCHEEAVGFVCKCTLLIFLCANTTVHQNKCIKINMHKMKKYCVEHLLTSEIMLKYSNGGYSVLQSLRKRLIPKPEWPT